MHIPNSAALQRAIDIQAQIESLQAELVSLLQGKGASVTESASPVVAATKRGKPARKARVVKAVKAPKVSVKAPKAPKAARTGRSKGGQPLAPAVVAVLQRAGRPLSAREILNGLAQDKYQWTTDNPLRMLSIRLYKLKGVKKVASGRFAPDARASKKK